VEVEVTVLAFSVRVSLNWGSASAFIGEEVEAVAVEDSLEEAALMCSGDRNGKEFNVGSWSWRRRRGRRRRRIDLFIYYDVTRTVASVD